MNAFKFSIKLISLFVLAISTLYLLIDNKPIPVKSVTEVNLPVIPYTVAKTTKVSIPIFSRGKVSPAHVRHITSEVPGLVTYVSNNLIKGGLVQKDELLIQLDQQPFILDIAKKQSSLDQAKLEFYKTKAKARVAKKGAGKNASDYARYVPQLRYANSLVNAASVALIYVKKQLEKTSIKAPITGKIIMANIHTGEYLKTTQELAKIYGTQIVEVRLPLNDHQLSLLGLQYTKESAEELSERPSVVINNFQDVSIAWHGTITRTEGERDKNQLIYVIATVNNTDTQNAETRPLLPGSFIEATITSNLQTEMYVLPRKSLQAEDNIWKINKYDRLSRQLVDVIYRGKDKIYVNSGLMLGERIVTGSFSNLVDGLLVEPKANNRLRVKKELTVSLIGEVF
ncbi:MAG: RND family efflux transporter MFP subunit [Psychrobacter glaciei]|jgi:RND family efflux transporter MFP subunit